MKEKLALKNKVFFKSLVNNQSKEDINGIYFKDVKNIVKSKEDLENILLSTKILFENKKDVIDFFDLLIKFGLKENAIRYFEDLINETNDIEIIDGFNSLLKKWFNHR